MDLMEMIRNRRSVRTYRKGEIKEEILRKVLEAGLLAPSGRNRQPWELIVVRDPQTLKQLSECRAGGAARMLASAAAAVVVTADSAKTDVWTEDCSNAMMLMHLTADAMGLGSCWIQGRLREAPDGRTAEGYVREILGYPEDFRLEAILSLGLPEEHPEAKTAAKELEKKVHWERYEGQVE